MEMYYLVLGIGHFILIPEKYSSEKACHEAGKIISDYNKHWCIPAPNTVFDCMTFKPDLANPAGGTVVQNKCSFTTGTVGK